MKKFIIGLMAAAALPAMAQNTAQVQTQDAYDYNRCSLSIIPMTGGGADSEVRQWVASSALDKFDANQIGNFSVNKSDVPEGIHNQLVQMKIGKKVLDYWVQFDGKTMNSRLLEERANYNATDEDVLKNRAAKVDQIFASGANLMPNSYVMVIGPTAVKENRNKKGELTGYTVDAMAKVFRVDINKEIITMVNEGWLDEETSNEATVASYNSLNVDLVHDATVAQSGTGKSVQAAVNDACNKCVEALDKKIEKWQVITTVYERHPLGAKIGLKEGLANSDRYQAFKLVEDADGNLKRKNMGYVRATSVIDNRGVATGEGLCSHFYQISGRNLKEGMFLKQKKDAKMNIGFAGCLNSYQYGSIDVNYLIHTSQTLGIMQYAGIQIGLDYGTPEYIWGNDKAIWVPVSLNYGIGIHPWRIFEIRPSVGIGADYFGLPSDDEEMDTDDEDSKFMKRLSYFVRGGVEVGVQVWYPVHLFVRADYAYKISTGEQWLDCEGHKRFNRLGFGAGVRINF